MFEWLTGGYVLAGFHEVVYTNATKEALEKTRKEMEDTGKHRVLWRISSTLFSHCRFDVGLSPLEEMKHLYNEEEAKAKYYPCTAFEKLHEELKAINLAPKQTYVDTPVA